LIYDVAIVGSGYAGSLTAMIARRLGLSVLLLERGTHPRVVIGESSTPLSNLLLEELALRYDLPSLLPLTKWGAWQQQYPELACGLKRGFTFHHHVPRQRGEFCADRQMLVAASPHDAIADTHWYRADVDGFLVREAQSLGVEYLDRVHLHSYSPSSNVQTLEGVREGREVTFHVKFVIDATGPRGFLHGALQLQEAALPGAVATRSLYNHFTHVARLEDTQRSQAGGTAPFPMDDAAVHHVFDGGWVWVLRFNNRVTSAGVVATDAVADRLRLNEANAAAWGRVLAMSPALQEQFGGSVPQHAFHFVPRLSFSSEKVTGEGWAMLPSAAGFVDPIFSTGFPLALLGIGRLAQILEEHRERASLSEALRVYAGHTHAELAVASRLVGALYASMADFNRFASVSLLYFAAASFTETARRLGRPPLAGGFLLHDHPTFGPASEELYARARKIRSQSECDRFRADVLRAIEPFDVAGLCVGSPDNWYPVRAEDLFRNAHKLGASAKEVEAMLARCGVSAAKAASTVPAG
jgi:FADH2 O2-dependent halogenase